MPSTAFRCGGEEFVVVMPGADAAAASVLAERLRERVAAETQGDLALTTSVGIATNADLRIARVDDLFQAADAALYAAKAAGRNRVMLSGGDRIETPAPAVTKGQ